MFTNPIKTAVTSALLASLLVLTGCSTDDNPVAPGSAKHSASHQDGDLELTLSVDQASYAFGNEVLITMSLRNTGSKTIPLDFHRGTPARYSNFNINGIDDNDVSHLAKGAGEADVTSLAPGAAITHSWVWDQHSYRDREPVERGFYELVGRVDFDNRDPIRVVDLFIELK